MNARLAESGLDWRALLPREHGLWGWLGVPLFGALVLAPHPTTLLATLAAFAGFGASNAMGRALRGSSRAWKLVPPALAVGALCALPAVLLAPRPGVLLVSLFAMGAAGLGGLVALGGRLPREPWLEAAGIVVLAGFAAAIGVGAGASLGAAVAVAAAVSAWLAMGLWWVNLQLARVMPQRTAWWAGPFVAAGAGVLALLLAWAAGHPGAGLVPLLYPLRMRAHAAATSARDARRVGLAELGWGLFAAALAALLTLL